MTERELKNLACEIASVSVFRAVLKKEPMAALLRFLKCEGDVCARMDCLGELVYSLSSWNGCLSEFLQRAVYEDENIYIVSAAQKRDIPPSVRENAAAELALFSALTRLDAATLCEAVGYEGHIPVFENHPVDFAAEYAKRLENTDQYGYGIFAVAGMFQVSAGEIVPVRAADEITPEQFVGYEDERRKIMENTCALIEGRPAANALLFGDAGTGKSSTVKACANFYHDRGLRLIELRKDQLLELPHVMGRIAESPLKFIIFIDDLSFNKNDDCFSMLKAALEGSAAAKAKNAVIYATSNRRHIVKEHFSDRAASDDVHHSDTMQELMSLSDRFGLAVYFSKPSKALYLDIVHQLAKRHGVTMEQDEMDTRAEAFALARGSRSPRAAEQFVKSLM